MLKEFFETVMENMALDTIEIDGRAYVNHQAVSIKTPLPESVKLHSLRSLRDLVLLNGTPAEDVIHIVSPKEVRWLERYTDSWEQRAVHAIATTALHAEGFTFGQYLCAEEFLVALLAKFEPTADREEVLKIVGNMASENSISVEDDGVTQKVAQKAGIVLRSSSAIKNPVRLAPFRTFREITQPKSEFILRVRQAHGDAKPQPALFEADGGAWQLAAMEGIADFLRAGLPGFTVLA